MPFPESVRNTAGFDKHPENINRDGQPPSIKRQLKELLAKNGEFAIPEKLLLRTEIKEGVSYYIFKLPTQKALANKLLNMAMRSSVTGLKAFQMVMEQIDGRPHQSVDVTSHDTIIIATRNDKV